MQQEFTLSPYLKIINFITGAVAIGAGIFLITLPNHPGGGFVYFIPIYLCSIGLYIIANALCRKVVITNDTITVVNVFTTRKMAIGDIKGFRFGYQRIMLMSNSTDDAGLIIRNYNSLNSDNQLVDYLTRTFFNLDAADLVDEQQNLLQDPTLGYTVEERQLKLDNTKKIAVGYNILGVAIAVGCIIWKQPALTILAIIYPLLSIAIMITSKGLIKFLSDGQRSVHPFVIIGFIAPSVALFAKSLAQYRIYSLSSFLLPFIGLGLILATLIFKTGVISSSKKKLPSQIILIIALSLFYAFGTIDEINCNYDKSPDHFYKAAVIGRHVRHGKGTTYLLYLSTWGPCHKQKQIDVTSSFYHDTNVGDSVKIDLRSGFLNIPWFVVYRN